MSQFLEATELLPLKNEVLGTNAMPTLLMRASSGNPHIKGSHINGHITATKVFQNHAHTCHNV